MNSFKAYGKVDELQEEAAFRRKSRKRAIILFISCLALILLIIVGVFLAHTNTNKHSADLSASAAAINSICAVTRYMDSCVATLASSNSTNPATIFDFSLMVAMDSLTKLATFPQEFANRTDDELVKAALNVCSAVLEDAVDSLNDTIHSVHARIDDLRTWLSTTVTDQETCLDALEEANATFADEIRLLMKNSTELASNSLAIVTRIIAAIKIPIPAHRRLLEAGFPAWVTAGDRRFLQEIRPTPNVTVAADGSGNVTSVAEAVARVAKKSLERFVIYVKGGVYVEDINMDKSYWNVMIYGDGKGVTIISGSKNYIDKTPTFSTPPFGE